MFGTVLVSMTGIALPVLVGVMLTPRSEHRHSVAAASTWSQSRRDRWAAVQPGLRSIGSLIAAVRHLPDGIAHTHAGRAG
jgi:hypothetical protein